VGLQVASPEEIRKYARGALQAADALERSPVPLPDVEQAIGLLPAQALFTPDADVPPRFAALAAKLAKKVMGGLAFPEKRIYLNTIDQALPRRRFVHGHEIGHRALPWHEQAYYADDDTTLDPLTRDALEQEANNFSAELLFGLDRFAAKADAYAPSIAVPLSLTEEFGTSAHSTLRRYAATSHHRVALLVLGRYTRRTGDAAYLPVMRGQCAQSPAFADRYGEIEQLITGPLPLAEHPALAAAAGATPLQPLQDSAELALETKRGITRFHTEVFHNGRLIFVLVFQRNLLSGRRLRAA
jgi:hypothetical protein